MSPISVNKKYLFACIVLALMLCVAQILGYTLPIAACLVMFMILIVWCCCYDFTLPVLLFFLPWSPILKVNSAGYSFYTFGMVMICLLSIVKKRFNFRNYQLKAGLGILFVSLLSKLIDGSGIAFDYIAFVMMIFLFPSVKEEWREKKYDFFQLVAFFAVGVIIASICALNFADYANIRRYIRVDAYLTIVRRSGFYGDANFYTAQILAAMGGAMALILHEKKKSHLLFLGIVVLFLLYCGFLSGSKSFVITTAVILVLWIFAILKMRGRAGLKVILIISAVLAATYIATSALFSGLIDVILTRFLFVRDLNSFTTGRTKLWTSYLKEIMSNAKVLFLGKGFTNAMVKGRASHNTLIQTLFQLGLVGGPILIYWMVCFFREAPQRKLGQKTAGMKKLIVLIGAFLPWLAIDMLFFDEFFLLQWYVFAAVKYFEAVDDGIDIETGSDGGKLWTRE